LLLLPLRGELLVAATTTVMGISERIAAIGLPLVGMSPVMRQLVDGTLCLAGGIQMLLQHGQIAGEITLHQPRQIDIADLVQRSHLFDQTTRLHIGQMRQFADQRGHCEQ
jgi:hypothetical protein